MTNEKIFTITCKKIHKEKSCCKNDDRKAEVSKDSTVSYRNGLHVITILFGCGLAMSILTLLPRHNSIKQPFYWFEIIFPAGFGIIFSLNSIIVDLFILMETETMIPIGLYLEVNLACILSWIAPFCSCYILWTKIFDYNHPMPFMGHLCAVFYGIIVFVILLRFSSSGLFEKQEFKRKWKHFVRHELL